MRCIPPVRLATFARGQLTQARADEVRTHLHDCAQCRVALQRISGAQDAMRQVADAPAPEISPAGQARGEATARWSRIAPAPRFHPWLLAGLGLGAATAALVVAFTRKPPAPVAHPAPAVAAKARPEPDPRLQAVITLLGGQVDLARAGTSGALKATEVLRAGDHLITRTESRVAAQWGEGSGFLLLGDAALSIDALERRAQKLAITRGEVDVRVGPHQPGEVMKVQSNAHVITVHGTWFTVAAAGQQTTVEVLEGVVEVAELDGSSATMLRAPARAVFGRGGRVSSGPLEARQVAERRAHSEMNLLSADEIADFTGLSGLVAITAQPSGTIAVDGVELGGSPMSVRRGVGRHYIEVARPHYKPLQKWVSIGNEPGELRVALLRGPVLPPTGDEPVAVEQLVKQRERQIRACYERSLKRDPSLTGTVSLRIKVGAVGQVTSARVEPDASTLVDEQVASCLEHEAATWKFASGRNATVVYPFVFRAE